MKWLELTLEVKRELADDLVAALTPYADGGISITSSQFEDTEGPGTPKGPMILRAYLKGDEALEENRLHVERALFFLKSIAPIDEPTYRWIEDQDWQGKWKQNYHPINIGDRLVVVPAWESFPDPDRIPIFIDPGMAFGTGAHPTTQLCLLALEEHIVEDDHVADLGAGSGILSIAARKLGASLVHAWDTDRHTVSIARENARQNKVNDLIFNVGSLKDLLQSPSAPYRLVVVNIFAHVITAMFAQGLKHAVRPGGCLMLSGILEDQLPPILNLARTHGFKLVDVMRDSDWTASIFKKERGAAPVYQATAPRITKK